MAQLASRVEVSTSSPLSAQTTPAPPPFFVTRLAATATWWFCGLCIVQLPEAFLGLRPPATASAQGWAALPGAPHERHARSPVSLWLGELLASPRHSPPPLSLCAPPAGLLSHKRALPRGRGVASSHRLGVDQPWRSAWGGVGGGRGRAGDCAVGARPRGDRGGFTQVVPRGAGRNTRTARPLPGSPEGRAACTPPPSRAGAKRPLIPCRHMRPWRPRAGGGPPRQSTSAPVAGHVPPPPRDRPTAASVPPGSQSAQQRGHHSLPRAGAPTRGARRARTRRPPPGHSVEQAISPPLPQSPSSPPPLYSRRAPHPPPRPAEPIAVGVCAANVFRAVGRGVSGLPRDGG